MYSHLLPLPPAEELPFAEFAQYNLKRYEQHGYRSYAFVGPPVVAVFTPETEEEYDRLCEYTKNRSDAQIVDSYFMGTLSFAYIVFVGFSNTEAYMLAKLSF